MFGYLNLRLMKDTIPKKNNVCKDEKKCNKIYYFPIKKLHSNKSIESILQIHFNPIRSILIHNVAGEK